MIAHAALRLMRLAIFPTLPPAARSECCCPPPLPAGLSLVCRSPSLIVGHLLLHAALKL